MQIPLWLNTNSFSCCSGVAVWREHGSPAMCQSGPHRAHQEALQQRHRLLCQTQRPTSRWGVDGWIQIPCLHGLEYSHECKTGLFFAFNHSVLLNKWDLSAPHHISLTLICSPVETRVNKNSDFISLDLHTSRRSQNQSKQTSEVDKWKRAASCLMMIFIRVSFV